MNAIPAPLPARAVLSARLLVAVLGATTAWADAATGVFTDRNATLLSLDADNLNDSGAGAHFAGARTTSVLDAGASTYYYNNGGRFDYWAIRPAVPSIQVGTGTQSVAEHEGAGGFASQAVYQVPKAGGGTVDVSVGYFADTHATASLATGILRSSAENSLAGPSVAVLPAAPYDGFGVYGTAYSRAEVADYLTASAGTTLHLTGIWEGTLGAGAGNSGLSALGSGVVLANSPVGASAHMVISIWSAPQSVFHPGDEESPGHFTSERTYLGGVEFTESVAYGDGPRTIQRPFDVTVVVPAGGFYFYASQETTSGGQTDPSQGIGGPVFTDAFSSANFNHTLQFNLTPGAGATLTSESGQFLTSVPEPGEWTALTGLALAAWAGFHRRRRPANQG